MVNEKEKEASKEKNQNKYQFGPGIGIIILGLSYVIWWVMPWAWKSYAEDPRWAHNWAYSIIILTVGLAWYQKTPISRTVAMIQSFMMPITAAGAIDSLICTYITIGFLFCWLGLVIYERKTEKTLYKEKMEPRTVNWVNMHTMILAWILIGHI